MDVKSILNNAAQSAVGNIEKAVIEIIDMRGRDLKQEPPVSMGGTNKSLGGLPAPSLSADSVFGGSAALTDAAADLSEEVGGRLLSQLEGATRKCFYVPFNPSELSISGYGGGRVTKTDYTSREGKGIAFEQADVRITLNVKLIFDKVDPMDAFMSDKLSSSVTTLAEGVQKGVRTALGKKDNSVQTEVEGFIAALHSTYTRRITFHWGRMNYTGVLNQVSAQYTMFNVKGQPIRAVVSLSLVCADKDVSANSMGVWQEYYYQAFQGGNQSYVRAAQKAGNLLGINL